MPKRVRAVLVSREVLRAERAMFAGSGFFNFSSKDGRESWNDLSGHQRTKQLISLCLLAFVDVRQSARYASLKAETGVRFP